MKKLFQRNHCKRLFYFVCFFILCICDQRIGSAVGEVQLVCPNIAFMVLSCLVLSHYPFSSYRRPAFWIPAAVCMAGAGIAVCILWPGAEYHYQLLSGAFAGFLYGCVLIQTVRAIVFRRQLPKGNHLGVWLSGLLLVLILLSRYDKYNAFLLFLSLMLMYLTDFTSEERDWMLRALGGAILTAFCVFQGLAFMFRPFDTGRYLGLYANTNINALLYQIVYCVFLSVFCMLELRKEHRFLKWGSFCFACAMWPFVMMTMCRSAILGMLVATFLGYGIILWKRREAWLRRTLLYVCGLLLGCVISFPVVYGAVRYLPAVFHHPVWFGGEYAEWKVHSWDPYDSEKYTDWRDVIQGNFGRLFPDIVITESASNQADGRLSRSSGMTNRKIFGSETRQDEMSNHPRIMRYGTIQNVQETEQYRKGFVPSVVPERERISGEGAFYKEDKVPEIGGRQAAVRRGSIEARYIIYRHYFAGLNLWGHKEAENGAPVSESYIAPHAHNILLQYAFNYGLPAGIVFLVYLVASGIRLLLLCVQDESSTPFLMAFLLFASIAAFGMTEIVWRYGQLAHTLLLFIPCFAWQQERTVSARAI